MKKHPSIIGAVTLKQSINETHAGIETRGGTMWVPARPLGYQSFISRIKCTWMVFTGKADALVWPCNQ